MLEWLGMPPQGSVHAAEIDHMMVLVHWLMLVLFVGWGAFFAYTLMRFRRSRHPRAEYTGVRSHFSSYVEGGVAIAEAVLLIGFAIPVWANRVTGVPPEQGATIVRVVAEQFAWNVHYPGADGHFGRTDIKLVAPDNPLGLDRSDPAAKDDITTINELNLPVNRPVIVHLSSKDVIHSFSLPQMRVKQDAIPGVSIPVWFVPMMMTPPNSDGTPGSWEINCSQLCGLGHYRMRGFYSIKRQAEFDEWLKQEAAALQTQ